MCGLCGWFTSDNVQLNKGRRLQRARAMEGLLIANQVRGTDSTGLAAIDFDGKYDVYKIAEEPWDFVRRDSTQKLLRRDSPIMIGHTRMTSMGDDVEDQNAHPFVEGDVIGAHNGIINNYLQLDKTVRVDSQAVFRMLDAYPGMMEYVFSEVSGSCALSWYDARDPKGLYLVAHLNPLAAAIIPSIETVFWSSEQSYLEPIMRAVYGKDVQFMDIKKDTVYRLDSSDVYSWQEMKVSFRGYGPKTYRVNGETYTIYDSDDDEWGMGYGYGPYAGNGYSGLGGSSSDEKDEDKGKSQGQESLNLPAVITSDEDRYEKYWDQLMGDDSASGSVEDYVDRLNEQQSTRSSLHDMTDKQYQSLEDEDWDGEDSPFGHATRFPIDMVEDLDCGYCDKPAGEGAAWDSGLEIMMCKPCQNWWDKYGGGIQGNYPEATA